MPKFAYQVYQRIGSYHLNILILKYYLIFLLWHIFCTNFPGASIDKLNKDELFQSVKKSQNVAGRWWWADSRLTQHCFCHQRLFHKSCWNRRGRSAGFVRRKIRYYHKRLKASRHRRFAIFKICSTDSAGTYKIADYRLQRWPRHRWGFKNRSQWIYSKTV